ncbi:glycosyltransferase family 4 protein [Candidatus Woesearchaeota archaeon]|nr:glycosyltransferase family 4 protein [Candidatus Woesearchaeota archaeon]
MKNLLIASDSFFPRKDGVASFLNSIIPKLAKKYRVTVLAPDFGEFKGYENVELVRFKVMKVVVGDYSPCWPSYSKIKKKVKEADIVWTQTIGPVGAMTVLAAKRAKKPLFAYIHSIEWELFTKSLSLNRFYKRLIYVIVRRYVKFLYRRQDLLLVPSVEVAELFGKIGVQTRKKVVHLGVNTDVFIPPHEKSAAKSAVNIDPDNLVVGFCGRISREKDLKTLYRAFYRVRKRHGNVVLLLVGSGVKDLEDFFRKKHSVILVGSQEKVAPFLQAMDIYVLPSLTETTSLSTLEAMSCELPVISTPVGYVKNYIENGVNGLFFPKKDSVTLYRTISTLIDNAALRQRLGKNARKTIVEKFSGNNTPERIMEVIDAF